MLLAQSLGLNSCVVGAGSVVKRDIPANSVAVGNPCRVIKTISRDDEDAQRND